ncbi:unnamed protein product, partial [Symbiodinium natans]
MPGFMRSQVSQVFRKVPLAADGATKDVAQHEFHSGTAEAAPREPRPASRLGQAADFGPSFPAPGTGKVRLYVALAAGLVADLQVELGERTKDQVTLGCELFRAAGAGDVALVRDLLEEGADPLLRHAGGQLPLHVAHGAPVVRELMLACPVAASVRCFAGRTPAESLLKGGAEAESLLLVLGSLEALEACLQPQAGKSLLGLLEPRLAREVLAKACGPVSGCCTVQEASTLLTEMAEGRASFWKLKQLWHRLPKGLEILVLRHLLFEGPASPDTAHRLQLVVEKLVARLCQDCLEEGALQSVSEIKQEPSCQELLRGLMQVLAFQQRPQEHTSCAQRAVDLALRMNDLEPTAFSTFLKMLPTCPGAAWSPDRDALGWLLLGFPTAEGPWPQAHLEESWLARVRNVSENDLYEAAAELRLSRLERCDSVAEELVQAVRSVRNSPMQGVEPLQVAMAWIHCARLWKRSIQAEAEVQDTVQRLLMQGLSQAVSSRLIFRCRRAESYREAWQKALAAWPRAPECRLPGLLVWDLLDTTRHSVVRKACGVTEVAMPTATDLRSAHDALNRLVWSSHGAEVLWTANSFDIANSNVDNFFGGCLREVLKLRTRHGPVLVEVRLSLSSDRKRASALEALRDLLQGRFEVPARRPLWARLLRLVLDLRGKGKAAMEAAQGSAREALRDPAFAAYAGQPLLKQLQELSQQLRRIKDEERAMEEGAEALHERAALAEKFLHRLASAGAFQTGLTPRAVEESPRSAVTDDEPAADFEGSLLQKYLASQALPAAPMFEWNVAALAAGLARAFVPVFRCEPKRHAGLLASPVQSACCAVLLPWPCWVQWGRRAISGASSATFTVQLVLAFRASSFLNAIGVCSARLWPEQPAEECCRSVRDVPLEERTTPRRSRRSGQSTPSTVDTQGSRRQSIADSVESQMEDATTPCIMKSQHDTEMPSMKQPEGAALLAMLSSSAPSSFEPGANVRLCSHVEMEFLWQALHQAESCTQQFNSKQVELETANNKLTDLVAKLEQELGQKDDEFRALQEELHQEREACSGARCRMEKLQHEYEGSCQRLQRAETQNNELTVLVAALQQQLGQKDDELQKLTEQMAHELQLAKDAKERMESEHP